MIARDNQREVASSVPPWRQQREAPLHPILPKDRARPKLYRHPFDLFVVLLLLRFRSIALTQIPSVHPSLRSTFCTIVYERWYRRWAS